MENVEVLLVPVILLKGDKRSFRSKPMFGNSNGPSLKPEKAHASSSLTASYSLRQQLSWCISTDAALQKHDVILNQEI